MSYYTAPSDSLEPPVIPNHLYPLKACQWRPSRDQWRHISAKDQSHPPRPPTDIRLVSWNVDFKSPWAEDRMLRALEHLQDDVIRLRDSTDGSESDSDEPEPCVIMLQEVNKIALQVLLADEWIREHFIVTPVTAEKWPESAQYGNVTLVSKNIYVTNPQILEFGISGMQRTAVMVDVKMASYDRRSMTMRIVNTHLESLPVGTIARPTQLKVTANFLKDKGVYGGIIAGDMNPVDDDVDDHLEERVGLRDAWRKLEGHKSHTWGFQGQNEEGFPCRRFDKFFYLPKRGYKIDEPKRIGIGLQADTDEGPVFTSDHVGLVTTLRASR